MASEPEVQHFVDITMHTDYSQNPPRNGILPSGLDCLLFGGLTKSYTAVLSNWAQGISNDLDQSAILFCPELLVLVSHPDR